MAISTGSFPKATQPGGLGAMFGKKTKKSPPKKKKC